ncbi:MAG: metal-dependent hydrolase [Alphaproteobacteria bacterium]|nr:metal-dependent hydrolase [Alphaproteobacteria bacterium]
MDSLTQFVLGAGVCAALLGPKIGPRNAILLGGALGTVPDLDTFLPAADPVDAFVSHRGATHSLIMQALVTPLFAEPLVRWSRRLRDHRMATYLAVYLIFATHALVDAMTVYGTQLLWPFGVGAVGVGSIFIIDPLYTLPLLLIALWALFQGQWSDRFAGWLRGALAVSTLYMLATIPAQALMKDRAETLMASHGVVPERVLAIPTPFNIAYWKIVAIDGDRYLNMYLPLFGDAPDDDTRDAAVYAYPRRTDLIACLSDNAAYRKLATFSDGFYRLSEEGGRVVMSDLRMGLTPSYAFRFEIAAVTATGADPLPVTVRVRGERGSDGDLAWLQAGILQAPVTRPAEQPASVALADLAPTRVASAVTSCTAG